MAQVGFVVEGAGVEEIASGMKFGANAKAGAVGKRGGWEVGRRGMHFGDALIDGRVGRRLQRPRGIVRVLIKRQANSDTYRKTFTIVPDRFGFYVDGLAD
jgi:hypothetical protein